MLKFSLVPIGGQFSYQGVFYTKSGPISATAEIDGKNRMIPRSANVKLGDDAEADEYLAKEEKYLRLVDIVNTVNDYHEQCLECLQLATNEVGKETVDGIKIKMNNIHQGLINNFNNM